ncbi:unnamed protein product [Sphagnum compactum]
MNAKRALASRRKESITARSTRSMELKRTSAAVPGVRDAAAKPLRKSTRSMELKRSSPAVRGVRDAAAKPLRKIVDLDTAVVKKDVLMACLMCNICKNTMQEVTTISECLHAFCRKCIFDAAPASCPVCNVDLGTRPLEKLKPDPTLNTLVKYFNSVLTTGRGGGRASSSKVEIAMAKDAAATTKKNHEDPACNWIADDEEAAVARAEEEEAQELLLLTCPKCKQPLEEEEEPTSITCGDHELICRRCTAFRAAAATVWPLCNVNLQRIMSPRRKMQLLDQPELSSFDSLLNSKVAGAPASSSSKETGAVTSGPAAAAKNRQTRKAAEATTASKETGAVTSGPAAAAKNRQTRKAAEATTASKETGAVTSGPAAAAKNRQTRKAAEATTASKKTGAVTSGPAAAAKNRQTRKAAEATTAPSAWTPASKRKRLSSKSLAKKNDAAARPATTGSLHPLDFAGTSHAAADPPKAAYLNCILNKCAHEEEDFLKDLQSIKSRRSLRIWTADNNNSVKLQMRRIVPPAVLQPPPQIAVAVADHDPIDLSLSLGQGRLDLHVPAATEYNAADAADQQQGMKNQQQQQQIWVHLQPATTTTTTTTKLVQLKLTNDDAATATGAAPAAPPPRDQELPPLDSPYLRIKDVDMPVSVLKSYLMRKLSLNPEEEDVDILQCHNSNNMIPLNMQSVIQQLLLQLQFLESFGDLPEAVQPKDLVALLSYKRKPLSLAALKTQSQLPT